MRRLLLLVLLLVLLPAPPASASTLCLPECAPVVVVGVPGLRWSDVGPATPTLARLSREGAVGTLSVKAVPAVSCPADGWLTLGAGNRVVADGIERSPCGAGLPADLTTTVEANEREREGAELDALVAAVESGGGCVSASGPGARLVGEPGGSCDVRLHDAPAVDGQGTGRVADALAVDRFVAALVAGAGTLMVVGLSEAPGDSEAGLHVAIAHGPVFGPGALRSASTRRAPYVQLVDVAPTVLDLLALARPASMTGQPWRSVGEQPSVSELADVALQAREHKRATVPFFVVLLGVELLLLGGLLWRRRTELAELVALGGVAALGASYLANLVPWWRSPAPLLTLLAVVLLISAAVVAGIFPSFTATRGGAQGKDQRGIARPAGAVCGFTAAVICVDLATGAHLQMSSVAGYSPLVAGRFAGLGNVAFGVLAAAVLLAAATQKQWVWLIGLAAVIAVGAPPWGSDVGGVLALVPALVLLALLLSGRRVTALKVAAAGAAGAAVVTAFALADWSRAEQDRTHLGRFVQDVADGTAGTLLRRKAEAVLDLLFASPLTALLPVVVAAAVCLVVRPPRRLAEALQQAPAWRAGLVATGLASAIGFGVNDSGAAVPAMALTVVVPATLAVVLRAREDDPALLA